MQVRPGDVVEELAEAASGDGVAQIFVGVQVSPENHDRENLVADLGAEDLVQLAGPLPQDRVRAALGRLRRPG